jgi:transcriptional regulator with XRE-family HTH domain
MDQRSMQETGLRDLGGRVAARRKKLGLSLRDAGAEIGVSFNTLARVEKGHQPDLENLRRLLAWIGESVDSTAPEQGSTPDLIAGHLRTDPLLPPDAAARIAAIVRDLYDALAKAPTATPVHLRAARTFTPDAARELADILGRMHERLVAGD